jgi:tRNA A-37 threonylcarbamoyl transferase component Bud32
LAPDLQGSNNRQVEEIMNFCRHIAASARITAACVCGDYLRGIADSNATVNALLVIHDFSPRLMNYAKVLGDTTLSVLAVDEWVFERDVDKGFLGEALASELIFPYTPLANDKYLRFQEVKLKKRLVLELLESLVHDFPELSNLFYIEPEYFMYEAMLTRARLYPPMMYTMASLTGKGVTREKIETVLRGYAEALDKLEQEGVVSFSNDYVRISPDFVAYVRRRRARFINLFKTGQRTLFASLLGIFPQILNFLSENKDLSVSLQRMMGPNARLDLQVEEPENHVYIPTSTGLAPLANRMDIEAFAREILGADKKTEVSVKSMGGILNDVFLVTANAKGKQTKVVVKRFRDWSNFKWFPLTLWSVGTRTFTVLGRLRLEKECAISHLLHSKGICVPKLLYVSPPRRLVFMEYVEGETLGKVVKNVTKSKNEKELQECLQVFEKVGNLFAHVHKLDIALGDTKPENIIVGKDGNIWIMDFEQADRNGDKAWDIAEFVYYAGHYISPFVEADRVEKMAKAFFEGYLKAGGDVRTVKNAGNTKYTKVFSVFTFPHVMRVLSNACKNADEHQGQ